jgi:hypothetical protein
VSYDFAVIATDGFEAAEEALQICDALFDDPGGDPPAAVVDLIDELERRDAIGDDDGFLSIWPVDANARGAVLCTRRSHGTTYAMLELTKDRGLAVIDLQIRQLFDPRGRVEVHVSTGNATTLPYLTERILHDVMARQDWFGDQVVIKRGEQLYAQAAYALDTDCIVEYRDGGPDRQYRTTTSDRATVARMLWGWTIHGPSDAVLRTQEWDRVSF